MMVKKKKLQIYVWEGFSPDWTGGLAVALASSLEEAQALVIQSNGGCCPKDWGVVSIHSLGPCAFSLGGGG